MEPVGLTAKDDLCPVCKSKGISIKNTTIRHMVYDDLLKQIGNDDYYLCMNDECHTVYYNQESGIRFNKEEVKVPIWFKKDADPKYACYCNMVTEEQIIAAVVNNGARDMKDIIRLTGAMKNGQCEIKNPSGKCCHSVVQTAINKGIIIKNKKLAE